MDSEREREEREHIAKERERKEMGEKEDLNNNHLQLFELLERTLAQEDDGDRAKCWNVHDFYHFYELLSDSKSLLVFENSKLQKRCVRNPCLCDVWKSVD